VVLGNSMKCRYTLQSYGIPVDQLPISYNGKIKLGYVKKWLRVRQVIESNMYDQKNPRNDTSFSGIIEFPRNQDVVFRQGSSSSCHAGNLVFRSLVIAKLKHQLEVLNKKGMKIKRRDIVHELVDEVQVKNGGRFLEWNDIGGWEELFDTELINAKLEYLIKELRKSLRANNPTKPQLLKSDTTMFHSSDVGRGGMADLLDEIDEQGLTKAGSCVMQCFNMVPSIFPT